MFLALYTFTPKYCPQCGEPTPFLKETWRGGSDPADYLAHAAHSCPVCGVDYQLADKLPMLAAARDSGGDLANYHQDVYSTLRGPELSRAVAARLRGYNP